MAYNELNINMVGIGKLGIDVANYVQFRHSCIKNVIALASDEDIILAQTEDKYSSYYSLKMKLFEFENTDCINIVTVDASERYECSLAANVCETFAMMNKPCMCIAVMPVKIGEPYYNATVNLDQIDTAQCAIVRLENNLYKDVCDVVFRIIYSFAECADDTALVRVDLNELASDMTGKYLFTSGYMDDITAKAASEYIVSALENYAPFKRCDTVLIFAEVGNNLTEHVLDVLRDNFLSANDFADVKVFAHTSDEHTALEGIVSIFARM